MNNDGHFKKIGGSKFIQTTITSSCKIKIDGESVYVDGEALSKAADVKSGDFDPDLHIMLSKISQHALDHEKWIITIIGCKSYNRILQSWVSKAGGIYRCVIACV